MLPVLAGSGVESASGKQLAMLPHFLLSIAESAVVLDLLLSLPEELGFLDYKKLKSHMHKSYMDLSAYYKGERSKMQAESSQPASNNKGLPDTTLNSHTASSHIPQYEEGTSHTTSAASSISDKTQASTTDWKMLGICPLNSFSFPLEMLSQKKESLDWESLDCIFLSFCDKWCLAELSQMIELDRSFGFTHRHDSPSASFVELHYVLEEPGLLFPFWFMHISDMFLVVFTVSSFY